MAKGGAKANSQALVLAPSSIDRCIRNIMNNKSTLVPETLLSLPPIVKKIRGLKLTGSVEQHVVTVLKGNSRIINPTLKILLREHDNEG